MCTLTLLRSADRLLVTMNRDERRSRADEVEPQIIDQGDVRWIGPADGEAGGTWFGANDRGVVACLLNAYAPGDSVLFGRDDVPSRGNIIPHLMEHSPDEANRWLLSDFDPSPYPSFTLLVATRASSELYSWRLDAGVSRTAIDAGWSVATSSWWRSEEVIAWRIERFEKWRAGGSTSINGVPSFNLLEVADQREWSPMMTRSMSLTRSLTQAEISGVAPGLTLRYWRREGDEAIDPSRPTAVETLRLSSVDEPT